jgi:peptidyl-dipeptidase Dcp
LVQKFSENSLKAKAQYELHVTNEAAIKTMPAADKNRAEEKAKVKNLEGYVFDASYGSYVAVLKYCSDQSIREQMYQDCSSFASSGEFDNRDIIIKMLNLRHQKAAII